MTQKGKWSASMSMMINSLFVKAVSGGGHSNVKGVSGSSKNSRNIRVVFQNHALYARTSFRGAKTCKIGKKGCVFGHIDKFWKGHDGQIACKHAYLGCFFFLYLKNAWLGCFLCVHGRAWCPLLPFECPPPRAVSPMPIRYPSSDECIRARFGPTYDTH